MTAPISSGWGETPGGGCTPWKAPPFAGPRRKRSLRPEPHRAKSSTPAYLPGATGIGFLVAELDHVASAGGGYRRGDPGAMRSRGFGEPTIDRQSGSAYGPDAVDKALTK